VTASEFAALRATYVEAWSAGWRALALPHVVLPLDRETVLALLRRNAAAARTGWVPSARVARGGPLGALAESLDAVIRGRPDGAFVRLGSRSAKDSGRATWAGPRVASGADAVEMLASGSARVTFDLRLSLRHAHVPHVVVRPWRAFAPWAEFRCFMRGRRLAGVSQYDPAGVGGRSEVVGNAERIRAAIAAFFPHFRDASPLADVVADVVVEPCAGATEDPGAWRVSLLDVNPFAPVTDACLFTWANGGDFDGSFRCA
jgi:hypothetical protein